MEILNFLRGPKRKTARGPVGAPRPQPGPGPRIRPGARTAERPLGPNLARSACRPLQTVGSNPTAARRWRRIKIAPGRDHGKTLAHSFLPSRLSRVASERRRRRRRRPALGKAAALPRLPRRRARSPEGEHTAVEVAAGGAPCSVWRPVPRVWMRDGERRRRVLLRVPASGGGRGGESPFS